jgi:2-polyprenyl-3-methyl-5-hydroxy-6-metoxy-1,4-benzoquinol methylase
MRSPVDTGTAIAAVRACPICGGAEVDRLHSMSFTLASSSPLPRAYDVVACTRCGFVYADTPGSAAEYARHYTDFSLYEDPRHATGSGASREDRERFEEMVKLVAARFPLDAAIVDVGCGSGGWLLALKEHGFSNLTGIDPSEGCVAHVRSLGFAATRATLDDIPGDVGPFDLVMLSHVLEHVLEPVPALTSLTKLLKAGGRIYLETPDASRYAGRPFVPYYFFDAEHINHFDQAALSNLARAAGLVVDCAAAKDIPVKGGHRYPAVYCLAAKAADGRAATPARDGALRQAVSAYLAECAERSQQFARLEQQVAAGVPLALWGAGSFAQRFLQLAWVKNHRIVAVVDRDRKKAGQEFAGCRIAPPDQGLRNLPANTVVLVLVALDAESASEEYLRLGLPYRHLVGSRF